MEGFGKKYMNSRCKIVFDQKKHMNPPFKVNRLKDGIELFWLRGFTLCQNESMDLLKKFKDYSWTGRKI